MALLKCHVCGGKVADDADCCPHCGHKEQLRKHQEYRLKEKQEQERINNKIEQEKREKLRKYRKDNKLCTKCGGTRILRCYYEYIRVENIYTYEHKEYRCIKCGNIEDSTKKEIDYSDSPEGKERAKEYKKNRELMLQNCNLCGCCIHESDNSAPWCGYCSRYPAQVPEELAEQILAKHKKGCFIATLCYGDYNCKQVLTFRHFRDNYLSKYILGKIFINIYYFISPIIVDLLKNRHNINLFIRNKLLEPLYINLNKYM